MTYELQERLLKAKWEIFINGLPENTKHWLIGKPALPRIKITDGEIYYIFIS